MANWNENPSIRARRLGPEFHKARNPMWIYDISTFAFLEVNQQAMAEYGYSREEFLSMTILDIRPPAEIPRILRYALRPEKRHESKREGWSHLRGDNSRIQVEVTSWRVLYDGRPAELVSIQVVTKELTP